MSVTEHDEMIETASTALVLRPEPASIVRQTVATAEVVAAQEAYHDLCLKLLDKSDYQTIGKKDFRKKSGWRKLAVAFNVSVELISREYERDTTGRIVRAEVVCRATAPNGRTMDGLGACDVFEKCCPASYGEPCGNKASFHKHCAVGCSGRSHFSNPQHDLPATAMTRATNRACADLFGMGEVSAEEMTDRGDHYQDAEPDPEASEEDLRLLALRIKLLPDDETADLRAKWKQNGKLGASKPEALTASQYRLANSMLTGLEKKAKARVGYDAQVAVAEAEGVTPQEPQEAPKPEGGADGAPKTEAAQDGPEGGQSVESDADAAAEVAGAPDEVVDEEIERVKAMPLAEVRAELEARGKSIDGDSDTIRKRLTIAVLKERLEATTKAGAGAAQ